MPTNILSQNIYWLVGAPFDGIPPGDPNPRIVQDLADIWRELAPDVICLQEIPSQRGYDVVHSALAERSLPVDGFYLPGVEIERYGGAIFHRTGKFVTDSAQSGVQTQRIWQIADVITEQNDTLRIANVHLPSNRLIGPEAGAKLRVEEMRTMFDTAGQPDIICGDCNDPPHGDVWNLLTERGYHDSADLAGQPDSVTTLGSKRVDYIFVSDRIAHRFDAYGVVPAHRLATNIPNLEYLSDHLPVWIRIR